MKNEGNTVLVEEWAIRAADHLEHIVHRIVCIPMSQPVIFLRVEQNNEVRVYGERPGEGTRHHHQLNRACTEQLLHDKTI